MRTSLTNVVSSLAKGLRRNLWVLNPWREVSLQRKAHQITLKLTIRLTVENSKLQLLVMENHLALQAVRILDELDRIHPIPDPFQKLGKRRVILMREADPNCEVCSSPHEACAPPFIPEDAKGKIH